MISTHAFMILVLVMGIAIALLGIGLTYLSIQMNQRLKGLEMILAKMQDGSETERIA